MSMLTIGVDPGITGAVAIIDQSGVLVALKDLPVIRDKSLTWIDGGAFSSFLLSHTWSPKHAVVERVSSMPRQGVSSCFKFGMGFGSVIATLQCLQIPVELVTPSVWKRDLNLEPDKKAALYRARMLWPTAELALEKHHNRAESLLIASWGAGFRRGNHG